MEKIEGNEIEIDVVNNPMFRWADTLTIPDVVDWKQLQYQNIYKSPDYVASKFTGDYSHLIGFDKIIENIAKKTKSPLDELISLYNIANEQKDRDNTNISQFKDCK